MARDEHQHGLRLVREICDASSNPHEVVARAEVLLQQRLGRLQAYEQGARPPLVAEEDWQDDHFWEAEHRQLRNDVSIARQELRKAKEFAAGLRY